MRSRSRFALMSGLLAAAMCFSTYSAFGADEKDVAKETKKAARKSKKAAAAAAEAAAADTKTAAKDTKTAVSKEAKATKKAAAAAATDAQIKTAQTSGQVWVNTESKVYHKSGRWYGKTKQGKFMSETDAQKAGYHEDKGEAGKKK
jgi:hypothetical protein